MTLRIGWSGQAAAALTIWLLAAMLAAPPAEPKTKRKGGGAVDVTQNVGAPIPDATAAPAPQPDVNGALISTIDVGKRFKGKRIRDVNVTIQTTGVGPAADDLVFFLTAPNGATVRLFLSLSGMSIGPLTIDDESNMRAAPFGVASNPFELAAPYQGTVRGGSFYVMDNGPVQGRWTLLALDRYAAPPATSVLNSWKLHVAAGRPYRTK